MQRKNQLLAALVLVLLLGSAVRIVGMTWGLPYQLQPDEPALFINAWERWDTGSARISEQYPPGYLYVLVAQREIIYRIFGESTPQVVYFFFARWNSILISLLILAVAYRLGRAMAGPWTGLAFALILTMEPVAALEVGWIIKVDNMAFLFTLLALLTSVYAVQRREWRWIGVSVLLAFTATITKYNMVFVLLAPMYAALYLILRRAVLSFVLMNVLVIGGLWAGWTLIHYYWVSDITPMFYHCMARQVTDGSQLDLPDRSMDILPCGPFYSFNQYAGPFYQRSQFWDAAVDQSFDAILHILRDDLKLPWLLFGVLALGLLSERERKLAALVAAVFIPTLAVFVIIGIVYPSRQYYALILCAALLIALGVGSMARRDMRIYVLLLVGITVTFGWDALQARRDLLKPDTRVATAEYFLHHARQGEAILVEYDHVEFAQQYGGFPKPEGYFNVIGLDGLFDMDAERLFADQIYYVVVDLRARGETSFAANEDHLPEGFTLVRDLNSDDYFGPARYIYRTFSPEHPLNVNFGDVAVLHGYDLRVEDDQLHLKFYWQAQAADLPDYTLFIHIIDGETGEPVTQRDAPPERHSSQWDQYEWVFDARSIPLDIPAGRYTVQIGFYDSATLDRLPVDGDSTGVLTLADFSIESF